mmetsp:Transcript_44503/g.74259  ORF Transcript_44503/g.74259 Transcript_44503/m.74259 type:complete len:299 (-) Transcript_44503:175-1071(-)
MPPRMSTDDDVKPRAVPWPSMSSIRRSRFLEEATMSMANSSEPAVQTWHGREDTQTSSGGRPMLTKCRSDIKDNRTPSNKPRLTRRVTLDGSHQRGGGGGFTTTTFSRLGVAFTEKCIVSQADVKITEILREEKAEEHKPRMGDQAKDARTRTLRDGARSLAQTLDRQKGTLRFTNDTWETASLADEATSLETSPNWQDVNTRAETWQDIARTISDDVVKGSEKSQLHDEQLLTSSCRTNSDWSSDRSGYRTQQISGPTGGAGSRADGCVMPAGSVLSDTRRSGTLRGSSDLFGDKIK